MVEPDDILKFYIQIINTNFNDLQYHLASNGVLEWYGRTFRNSQRIIEYFKHDFCEQYEHNFTKGENCLPFDDDKETHLSTKALPPENLIETNVDAFNIVPTTSSSPFTSPSKSSVSNIFDGYSTPPQMKRSPILPPLTQGRKFIEDSDTEESDLDCNNINVSKKSDDSLNLSGMKLLSDSVSSCEASPIKRVNKQTEYTVSHRTRSALKRSTTKDVTGEPSTKIKKTEPISIKQSPSLNQYSELKYIQSNGFLRQTRPKKHRGIILNQSTSSSASFLSTPSSSNSNDDSNLSLQSTPSTSSGVLWERTTCLKLSYRLRLIDNQIQFALIIYETLTKNPKTRRNLFNEFKQIAIPKTKFLTEKKTKDSCSKSSNCNLGLSKKSLRF